MTQDVSSPTFRALYIMISLRLSYPCLRLFVSWCEDGDEEEGACEPQPSVMVCSSAVRRMSAACSMSSRALFCAASSRLPPVCAVRGVGVRGSSVSVLGRGPW